MNVSAMLAAVEERTGGWIGQWSPGIGDPSVVGWVTVAAYFVAALLCWRAYRRVVVARASGSPGIPIGALVLSFVGGRQRMAAVAPGDRLRALWFGLTVFLLMLGINKQLDLQTALTEGARMMAISEGWYDIRRPIQVAFIVVVAAAGVITFRAVVRLAGDELRALRSVIGGVLFLTCFVTIRAASFHHIERLLGYDLGGFYLNWLIELGGIAFVAAGAWRSQEKNQGASR
jgi:hypothetical protein